MTIIEYLSQPLWQQLAMTLVHFIWQGLVLALLVSIFVSLFRVKHGNGRYIIYLAGFLVMTACPLITFIALDIPSETVPPAAITEITDGPRSTQPVSVEPETALPSIDLPKSEIIIPSETKFVPVPLSQRISDYLHSSLPWLLAAWMTGVLLLSIRLLMGFIGIYLWRRNCEPLPERLIHRVKLLGKKLGLKDFSRVFISARIVHVIAIGYLRPMVLLPASMITQMTPEMLEAVIAHELAHIRRFDLWINLIQRIAETLLFYHPAVWWLSGRIRSEQEFCCDELAVNITGQRLNYAAALESAVRITIAAKQPAFTAGLCRDKKPLLKRVRYILGLKPAHKDSPSWITSIVSISLITLIVLSSAICFAGKEKVSAGEDVSKNIPEDVQQIDNVLQIWLKACRQDDTEEAQKLNVADTTPLSRKMQETKTILELIGEDRVTPIQVIQFKIEGTKGAIVTSVTKGDFIFKGEPNYIAAAFFNVGDNWLLKAISFSKKAELEEYMKYAPEKYPDAKIWFDESAPDWLKLDLPPGVDIDIDALKNITETVKVDNSLAEKLRADLGEKEIFESYFPDSNEGGKALDVFWPQREKDPEADKKIFDLVRNGLRKDGKGSIRQNRNQYITTIGSKYIWQSGEQNKDAIELLYYASYDPRLAGDAVYYGLSVVREKNDKIIKRLVEMCMEDVSVGRIVWGVRAVSKMQETQNVLLAYLKPYLESNAPNIKERANVMEGVLKGEIDYDKWVSEQTAKRLREGFGDKLDDIKIVLLKGNSYQRKETLNLIRRNQLSLLFDMSFEEPLRACFADGDPTVKEYAINSYRTLFSKPGECPDDILEIMDKLSTDGDRTVKNAAVIFVGSNWVWGARPQNPKAIDIMYRLSSDKDRSVRYNAVYYGLSVVENKNKKIIERLVDMAMDESNDLGRIAWGLGMGADMQTLKEVLSSYLKPNSAYSERAGQLYKEIFKIDPPGVTSNTDEQKAGAKILQTADKESLFLVNLIKSAEEGSIVSVPKGTYKIPFVIDKKLTLKGEDANNCIIEITMNGPAIVIDTKAKGKVTLENLTIKW